MAIKKRTHWDSKLQKYFGFDEFSNKEQSERGDPVSSMATQALVFYIVGLDGSEAIEEFCRQFNKLFDILNSWNVQANGDKTVLTKENLEEKSKELNELALFLAKLKLLQVADYSTQVEGKPVLLDLSCQYDQL
ncbi:hypothetical protein GHT06_017006 [Daphnia sinensis]|uniref:Transposable element P transposase-like RNase H domain-containing protein n=1 Tax=Daphnia sinensis TaxID=1820382 RepID=A0AAD5KPA8_9CRUS|nr:hypothetical protein GHT06_017006 [Daphnia sinensis]